MDLFSGPRPGALPGPALQDPVLLDDEREKIGSGMIRSGELLREKVCLMAKLFASVSGHVVISYPCRDLLDDRELLPSSIVLNAYRLISGNRSADYSDLAAALGDPAGFIPTDAFLSESEWWLAQAKKAPCAPSILQRYSALMQGKVAADARMGETITVYDGYIPSAKGAFDPYAKNQILSASRLEGLAACPFKFFAANLLHIEPLEDLEKDPNQWLKPNERGSLLHDVFRRFMEEIAGKGERPNQAHAGFLKDLAMKEVEKWKELMPPPSSFALEREISEILQTCETFLRDEAERCGTAEPCLFELSFGMKEDGGDGVEIPVGQKGSFLLRGRIDRIDRCGRHVYEVWDYKTGSSWGYKETDYYRNGRQIQHFLYSAAAERLLRQQCDPEASVIRGGYYFPGPKGEGLRIERNEQEREKAFEILDNLFALLAAGVFPPAYDADACTYCPYVPACGGAASAVARCRSLLQGPEPLLEPLRRLAER